MKIYTKGGDKGKTSLVGGARVSKAHPKVEAYGTVDELISVVGVLRSHPLSLEYKNNLHEIQNRLMDCAALLASEGDVSKLPQISENDIEWLEKEIDEMNLSLAPLTHFIIPGNHPDEAMANWARTVCRRAERCVVRLAEEYEFSELIQKYLNRLSDYFFTLSRKFLADYSVPETYWMPPKN